MNNKGFTILIIIFSIINAFIIVQKESIIAINPEKTYGNCNSISTYGKNGPEKKNDPECLKSIERGKQQAENAENYLNKYKSVHITIAIILEIFAIITFLYGIVAKGQKLSELAILIVPIIINLLLIF